MAQANGDERRGPVTREQFQHKLASFLGEWTEDYYRCTACGNLTRFDVTSTRRSRAFHHYTVGGDLEVEDVEILDEQVESVVCHWCGTSDAVVELDAADAAELAAGDD